MVNVNAKSPLSKRKSVDNAGDSQAGGTPKVAKLNTSLKTPGKGKNFATPGKGKNFATPGKGKNTPTPGKGKNTPTPGKGKNMPTPDKGNNTPTPGKGKNTPTPGKGKNVASPGKGKNFPSPGKGKNFATPGKGKNVATPGKGQNATTPDKGKNTPETTPKQNNFVKAPQADTGENVAKTPKTSPLKNQQQNNSVRQNNKKNKRASTSENESSPPKKQKMVAEVSGVVAEGEPQQPKGKNARQQRGAAKKLQKFPGTSGLEQAAERKPLIKKEKKVEPVEEKPGKPPRKTQFYGLKQKVMAGDKEGLDKLEQKIKVLENNKDLSKTAMKKLKQLKKVRDLVTGVIQEKKPETVAQKRKERRKNIKAKHVKGENGLNKEGKSLNAEQDKEVKVEEALEKKEATDSSDYEVEAEITPDKITTTMEGVEEESSEGDEEGDNVEEEEDGDDVEEEEDGDDVEEEEETLDVSNEAEVSEEDSNKPALNQKDNKSQGKSQRGEFQGQTRDRKQTRYVLYVGNLPYDITKEEVSEHFKTAGNVRDIRIPNDRETNKPRGFAYVEFHDETTYQKGLSLHHTFIKNRRINVNYTQGGNKQGEERNKEMKAKNFKLHAMRKQGQLAGSVRQDQKRSFRRAKQTPRVNGDS